MSTIVVHTRTVTVQDLAREALQRWGEHIDPERLDKAIHLTYQAGAVYQVLPGVFEVASSIPGEAHIVRAKEHSCTCADHHFHPNLICKHRLAAWLTAELVARRLTLTK